MDEIFYWGQSSTDSFNFLFSRIFTLQRFFTIFKSNLDFHHSSIDSIMALWHDEIFIATLLLNLEGFLTLSYILYTVLLRNYYFCLSLFISLSCSLAPSLIYIQLVDLIRSLAVINVQYLILIFTQCKTNIHM